MTAKAEQLAIAYGIRLVECERSLPRWLVDGRLETAHALLQAQAAFERAMARLGRASAEAIG